MKIALLLFLALELTLADPLKSDLVVGTRYGEVKGKIIETPFGQVEAYLGIPYAKAPVGKLRFKKPQPPEPWDTVRDATEFGQGCTQRFIKGIDKLIPGIGDTLNLRVQGVGEDCLFLNVWVPRPRPKNASVMVVFHGGGFVVGAGSLSVLDGAITAALQGVVYVSFNHRLGSLGFTYLDHPEIDPNVGMLDQVSVLNWVNENIVSFGGDPNNVTLMGQSSGSISVGLLLVSPLSKGLFKRAIMMSGSALYEMATKKKSVMVGVAQQMADYMDCPDWKNSQSAIADCLMNADPNEMISNEPHYGKGLFSFWFFPVIDGYFLTKHPEESYKDGDFGDVKLLTGIVKNEGSMFLMMFNPLVFNPLSQLPSSTLNDIKEGLDTLFNYATDAQKKEILDYYFRDETDQGLVDAGDDIIGDFKFKCGMVRTSRTLASKGNKVYSYYFAHRPNVTELVRWLGIPHAADFIFVSGYALGNGPVKFDEQDQELSRRINTYVGNFAKTGDPNQPKSVDIHWPPYTKDDHRQLVLAPKNRTILVNLKERDCAFWDSMGHIFPHDRI